ncbi:hypothetical protein Tco_1450212 [Tanacetum coccineum]
MKRGRHFTSSSSTFDQPSFSHLNDADDDGNDEETSCVIEQFMARSGTDLKMAKLVMSSPSHPTSNIEDAFSSNFPDYIPASPDYVPASPG